MGGLAGAPREFSWLGTWGYRIRYENPEWPPDICNPVSGYPGALYNLLIPGSIYSTTLDPNPKRLNPKLLNLICQAP